MRKRALESVFTGWKKTAHTHLEKLVSHMEACHAGRLDVECAACQELIRKAGNDPSRA